MLAAVAFAGVASDGILGLRLHERVDGADGLGLLALLGHAVDGLDGVLAAELVHLEDALLGGVSPKHGLFENGDSPWSGHIGWAAHDVVAPTAVVVDRLYVVQEDV